MDSSELNTLIAQVVNGMEAFEPTRLSDQFKNLPRKNFLTGM